MTTRSGLVYRHATEQETRAMTTTGSEEAGNEEPAGISELAKLLLEDQRKRELAEERARRESAQAQHVKHIEEQLGMMKSLVERSLACEEKCTGADSHTATGRQEEVVLTKFTEGDIEAYLTTFERIVTFHGVEQAHWAIKLAP